MNPSLSSKEMQACLSVCYLHMPQGHFSHGVIICKMFSLKARFMVGPSHQFDDYLRRCLFEVRSRSLVPIVDLLLCLSTQKDCLAMCLSIYILVAC